MKIVMLTRHACIRVLKEALPLTATGHEVHIVTNKITQYSDLLASITVYQSADQLYRSIELHKDADVFHAHNEPSWFVTIVKEIFPDKPVILDVHDTFLLRRTPEECEKDPDLWCVSIDERNNIQLADGLVYVCDAMKEKVEANFKPDCPSIVLPSYVPERFNRIDFRRWYGGLCYEGRIDIEDELPKDWNFFQYSNYLKLADKCNDIGMDFHVYTPRDNVEVRKQYHEKCFLHEPLKLHKLIKAMGAHDWGLVGNIDYHEEWHHALPNKLFEYISACLPIVAINAGECSKFIEKYGVGITVSSMEELAERWSEHRECRNNLIKIRRKFTMDNHIDKLRSLYQCVTGEKKPYWIKDPKKDLMVLN